MGKVNWQRVRKGQRGFSLVETIASVFIIGTVGVGVVLAMNGSIRAAVRAEESVTLAQLIRAQVETIQQSPFKQDPTTYPAISSVPAGFTVTWSTSDPGTTYTYPAPLSTTLTGVVQKITVTASGDFSSMSMIFYKVRMP